MCTRQHADWIELSLSDEDSRRAEGLQTMREQRVTFVLHPVSSEQISSALEVFNSGEARVSEDNKLSYNSTRRSTVLRYIPITLVISATPTPSGIPPCHCSELTRCSVGMRTKSMICLRRVRQSEQRRDWRDTRWIPVGSDLQRPDSTCSVTTQECRGITLMRFLRSLSISFQFVRLLLHNRRSSSAGHSQ